MCRRLVLFDDDDAMSKIAEMHRRKAYKMLCEKMPADDAIFDEMINFKLEQGGEVFKSILKELDGRSGRWAKTVDAKTPDNNDYAAPGRTTTRGNATTSRKTKVIINDDDSDECVEIVPAPQASRGGRGRGRGRGASAAATSSTRAKPTAGSKNNVVRIIQNRIYFDVFCFKEVNIFANTTKMYYITTSVASRKD